MLADLPGAFVEEEGGAGAGGDLDGEAFFHQVAACYVARVCRGRRGW